MNKSDIMKAAEKCKDLLEGCNNPIPEHLFTAEKALIAAAELLKQVEVLPEGSEPIVGDIITWTSNAGKNWEEKHCEIYNRQSREIGFWGHLLEENCKPKIIQRNGKPVIFEKEGV